MENFKENLRIIDLDIKRSKKKDEQFTDEDKNVM